MRKLQQVAVVVATVGSLSTIGAGVGFADGYVGYGGVPATPQPGAPQMTPQLAPQAGAPQTAAQTGAPQVTPLIAPQLSPRLVAPREQVTPRVLGTVPRLLGTPPQSAAAPQPGPRGLPAAAPQSGQQTATPQAAAPQGLFNRHESGRRLNRIFHPYQECSPQTVLEATVPISVLASPESQGFKCTQVNRARR